jgi:hypothetical protein
MFLDDAGRQLMAERNGEHANASVQLLGPPKPTGADAQQAAALLAPMQTNRQARMVLGVVAQYLQQGYQTAATVPSFISPIDGTSIASKAMISLLDTDNRYAMRVYAGLPDNDAPVSPLDRKKVALAVTQALSSTKLVSTEAADLNRGLVGSLIDLFKEGLQKLATDAAHNPLAALKWAGVGLAVLIGLFIAGKLVHTIAFGGAGHGGEADALLEAEEAAVAIMGARLRKPRRKR